MEQWRVIGFSSVDFTDKSGNRVAGYSLYLTRPGKDRIQGDECQKLFISEKLCYEPALGDVISLLYNRYGKVADIQVA